MVDGAQIMEGLQRHEKNLDGSHKSSVLIQHDGVKYIDNTSLLRTKDTSFTFQVQ